MEEKEDNVEEEEPITTTILEGLAAEAGKRTREAVEKALTHLTRKSPDLAKSVDRVGKYADGFISGLVKSFAEEIEDAQKK